MLRFSAESNINSWKAYPLITRTLPVAHSFMTLETGILRRAPPRSHWWKLRGNRRGAEPPVAHGLGIRQLIAAIAENAQDVEEQIQNIQVQVQHGAHDIV